MRGTLRRRAAWLMLLAVAGTSCESSPRSRAAKPQATGANVTHVVLCWLKTPGDEAARRRIIEASRTFRTIPGVASVTAGTALPSTRPVVDSSYDVAVVITFTDEAALRAYEGHPTHRKAADEVLKPLVGKLLIYDFKGE